MATRALILAAALLGAAPATAAVGTSTTASVAPSVEDLGGDDAEWGDFEGLEESAAAAPAEAASDGAAPDPFAEEERVAWSLHGFAEAAGGTRVASDDATPHDYLLAESRGRLDVDLEAPRSKAKLVVDFVGDAITEEVAVDLRQAWADVTFGTSFSARLGRQILTWGTGDLVFLNDLFPKDFVSFFVGREDQFLKAPSDSVKLSFGFGSGGIDYVWTPIFAPDRLITGERLSFFFPPLGQLVGPGTVATPLEPLRPPKEVESSEHALRLYGQLAGWELAAYGYIGFTKQPLGFDPVSGALTHPRLGVYGASVRGLLFGGVVNLEGAFHHAWDDVDGNDPFVANSQLRGLIGYEFEPFAKFTVGVQGYVEYVLAHDALLANSPAPQFEPDELRLLGTLRLTFSALSDNLRISLFAFVSPTDVDAHLRPSISYKLTQSIELTLGGNVMFGRDDFTFFGQLEDNTNAYARLRYTF